MPGYMWKENVIFRGIKRVLYEREVMSIVMRGSETWSLSPQNRRKTEVCEMMYICGIRRSDRGRSMLIRDTGDTFAS